MPQYYLTRTDQMTQAVNTFAAIETNADGSTGGAVPVPPGVSRVVGVRYALGLSAEVATDSGGVVTLRLGGNGLRDGQQEIVLCAVSSIAQGTPATGIVNNDAGVTIPVELAVNANGQISLQAAYSGVDFGTPEIGITLIFQ